MRRIVNYCLLILIGLNFIYVFSGVFNFSIQSIDVISIWLYKAKGFYIVNGDVFKFLSELEYSHPQYPILLPYFTYLLLALLGGFEEIFILSLYPFLYLIVLYLCYRTLILFNIEKSWSLLFTYIYSMFSPLLAMGGRGHAGEADIFIVIVYWLVLILSYKFKADRKRILLFIITLIIGVASNIKTEGLLLSFVFLLLPITLKNKFTYIFLSVVPFTLWFLLRVGNGIISDLTYTLPSAVNIIERTYYIFLYTLKEMVKINNWYIFWPLLIFSLFLKTKHQRFISVFMWPLCTVVTIGYFANYLFSSYPPQSYVPSSIDRILMQVSPLYYTFFAKQTSQIISKI